MLFLDFQTNKCECLYLALEDSANRLQKRLKDILKNAPVPDGFHLATNCSPLNEGLIEELENKLQEFPNIKLIIIDTLQFVRGSKSKNESDYAHDYKEISTLKKFADKHEICILAIHHLRKAKDSDVFNQISGSVGLTGSADTMITLSKSQEDKSRVLLSITGRDVEQTERLITFDKGLVKWELLSKDTEKTAEQFIYSMHPVVKTLNHLLDNNTEGQIKITATELLVEIYKCTGIENYKAPQALTREINSKLQIPLLKYDNINYEPPNSNGGSNGRTMYFRKSKNINK